MKINILPSEVYNRISAGEVVENPASVVKELVENSIDAGATSVSIDIENGGPTKISVSDNGKGISPDDVPTAFLPHAEKSRAGFLTRCLPQTAKKRRKTCLAMSIGTFWKYCCANTKAA